MYYIAKAAPEYYWKRYKAASIRHLVIYFVLNKFDPISTYVGKKQYRCDWQHTLLCCATQQRYFEHL